MHVSFNHLVNCALSLLPLLPYADEAKVGDVFTNRRWGILGRFRVTAPNVKLCHIVYTKMVMVVAWLSGGGHWQVVGRRVQLFSAYGLLAAYRLVKVAEALGGRTR